MVYFQTRRRNLGKFCRVLQWKMLVFFVDIVPILRPYDIIYDRLVYFVAIWNIFPPCWYIAQRKIWQPWLRVRRYVTSLEMAAF
jgi:hypothetical protein